MIGFGASVLSRPDTRLLVVGVNWLGDGVMSMPALQLLREHMHSDAVLDLLVKPGQRALWEMHEAPGTLHVLAAGSVGPVSTGRLLRAKAYTHCVVLPNSVRSALAPLMAGIPLRRGAAGHFRRFLLNDVVDLSPWNRRHQQEEMAELLLGDVPENLPAPLLSPPESAQQSIAERMEALPGPKLGLIPGAARGASKCWPGERYREVAEAFLRETGGSVVWMGTADDRALCEQLRAGRSPERQCILAGETNLQEFTAALREMDVVVANDSGGMHLAAAVRTPVVAVYGITSPEKTGPLGDRSVVLQHSDIRSRSVPRESEQALRALEAVSVAEVSERVLAFLETDR